MKALLKKSPFALSLIAVIFMAMSFNKEDKCVNTSMTKEGSERLKKYTLIENYPFHFKQKKKKDPVEYKKQLITLNRGVKYKFYAVRNNEYEGIPVVTIYNNEKMEFLIASTYNFNTKKFYNEVEFECKTTGNYCLALSFLDGLEGCALSIYASLIKE
jgi:hypothetical protein